MASLMYHIAIDACFPFIHEIGISTKWGQIEGAVVQSIGFALNEEIIHKLNGQQANSGFSTSAEVKRHSPPSGLGHRPFRASGIPEQTLY
jgi:hypothetical protein